MSYAKEDRGHLNLDAKLLNFTCHFKITGELHYGWLIGQMSRCTNSWEWRAECFAERKQASGI